MNICYLDQIQKTITCQPVIEDTVGHTKSLAKHLETFCPRFCMYYRVLHKVWVHRGLKL